MGTLARKLKARGKTIVFTNGCFDILHLGHARYLQAAKAAGDILVVAVNSDRSVRQIKGDLRPLAPQEWRAEVLCALACVDYVVIFDEADPGAIIGEILPHVLVKGADWPEDAIIGADTVKAGGGRVVRVTLTPGASTTALIEEITHRYCRPPNSA
ncbi:MAG: D-glycero-beta-D-manno-heptose 1-phosphate adenylyltransferase [Deltaproteobacteria bacterium]|nr:D-glycero-beta-D-manno-heptose 1-phosphate adenylyltransferase [Deltaproteobacteria bacterium]